MRRFVIYAGHEPIEQISDRQVEGFIRSAAGGRRGQVARDLGAFLRFAAERRDVPAEMAPLVPPSAPARAERDRLAPLRQKLTFDRFAREKEAADELIARLAHRVIDHFLYFRRRIAGEPDDLDEIYRLADEAAEIIHANLQTFMRLQGAGGLNVHAVLDAPAGRRRTER
ncbi:MAG TPA: hypothetical protein VNN77_06295 [candidate division Zixibacteria bacterium]|nr:hypothetical protein [candidate division Zixibacteria bacterium]